MAAKAVVSATPNPTEDDVRQGMTGNICRCSNYNRYVAAVLDRPPERATDSDPMSVVGQSRPRIDAVERVTGAARYTGDVKLAEMAYARVLRSPHPHARITGIDTRRAREMPGVYAVLTRENCDTIWRSGDQQNPRYLFNNPVRFVGDPVAAVAAVDRHVAEAAIQAIEVDYEPLDFVLDPEEALQPGAVEIQPGGNLSRRRDGEALPETYQRGSVDAGFAAADVVVEETYVSKHHSNAQMEPRSAVARWEGDELTLWTPTQGISNCRSDVARDLDLPPEQVRVVCEYMGGGFGNKNQCQDADLMAALLRAAGGASGQAGADAEGRLSRGPRPLADGAALPGGSRARRDAAGDSAPGLQRDGAASEERRRHRRDRAVPVSQRAPRSLAGLHQHDRRREFPGSLLSAGGLGDRIGHGPGGPRAGDRPGRLPSSEPDARLQRRDALYQLGAPRMPHRGGRTVQLAGAVAAGRDTNRSAPAGRGDGDRHVRGPPRAEQCGVAPGERAPVPPYRGDGHRHRHQDRHGPVGGRGAGDGLGRRHRESGEIRTAVRIRWGSRAAARRPIPDRRFSKRRTTSSGRWPRPRDPSRARP